jgi:hypothetical protein
MTVSLRFAVLAVASLASASEDVMTMFDPRATSPGMETRLGAEARWYAPADAGGGELGVDRESLQVSQLVGRGERDEWWIGMRAAHTAYTGDARLTSGAAPAGRYLDVGLSGTWKRRLGEGDVFGVTLGAGLSGQTPIAGGMDAHGNISVFGRVGLGPEGRDGLLLALNYDPDRVVLSGVPVLPLVAWQAMRGPWFLVLGVPFSVVTYRAEAWSATAVVGPLPSVSADARVHGPLRAMIETRWNVTEVRRADRVREDDRLRQSQWESAAGLRLAFGPAMRFDAIGGIATARRLGETEEADDARREGIRLDAAPFAAFRGRVSF